MAVVPVKYEVAKKLARSSGENEGDWARIMRQNTWTSDLRVAYVKEDANCSIKMGIDKDYYSTLVHNLVESWGIPSDHNVVQELLDREHMDFGDNTTINFKFDDEDGGGACYYGRIITLRHSAEKKMDLAYTIMSLDFELTPETVMYVKDRFRFWFKTGVDVWYETINQDLSVGEKNDVEDYVKAKAMSQFYQKYKGYITA